ncbi:hypothetical protein [Streptomyces sp. Rer75]|uniref:hypothetical protein n=1 Tax=Streptomyces sp. Rer75 TaxID=2750011 RepID=UPI0015CFA422|nr:hypothetical protein [Streptomyces sp. Rer75]QLH26323.1 hypothetical protein HYQ63_41635 [Streptomyces sp. Rer75]
MSDELVRAVVLGESQLGNMDGLVCSDEMEVTHWTRCTEVVDPLTLSATPEEVR